MLPSEYVPSAERSFVCSVYNICCYEFQLQVHPPSNCVHLVKPHELAANKMSVGAVNWDGAFAMVAYLGAFVTDCKCCSSGGNKQVLTSMMLSNLPHISG